MNSPDSVPTEPKMRVSPVRVHLPKFSPTDKFVGVCVCAGLVFFFPLLVALYLVCVGIAAHAAHWMRDAFLW